MEAFEEFFEFDSFAADSYGVCALEFDSQHDLLLVGNVEGRFSTFYMADVEKIEDENFTQPRWGKYSSVAVARDPVLDILPTPRHVLALSKSQIAAVSVGGLRHASISIPQQEDIGAHEFRYRGMIRCSSNFSDSIFQLCHWPCQQAKNSDQNNGWNDIQLLLCLRSSCVALVSHVFGSCVEFLCCLLIDCLAITRELLSPL